MKKVLMLLSLVVLFANSFAMEDEERVINLGEKKIYSETGFENSLRSTTSSLFVVDSKTIEKKKYTSVSEILNDISAVNGLDIRGQGRIKLKDTVQLLIDGIPSNFLDTSHQSAPINVVNVADIERIEIIPGGGAVLYGSGTSGGIINIITKKYKKTYAKTSYQLGSYHAHKFDVAGGTTLGNFDVDLSYSKNDKDGYRKKEFSDSNYFLTKLKYNINKTDSLEFRYNFYDNEFRDVNALSKKQMEEDRRQSALNPNIKKKK